METITTKIKKLKVNDTVVIYYSLGGGCMEPYEETIKSKGSKYIHTNNGYKFETNGYGEYGWYLFPGNMCEYKEWEEIKKIGKNLLDKIKRHIDDLSFDELKQIEQIFEEK